MMIPRRSLIWSLIAALLSSWLCGIVATPAALAAGQAGTRAVLRDDSVELVSLYRSDEAVEAYIAPPAPPAYLRAQAATFTVEYRNFPPEAQAAFQHAVNIWQSLLTSPVPISVVASWETLEENVLGSAGAINRFANFDGAPQPDTYYPGALANKLAGADLAPAQADIQAIFNSEMSGWYFGTGQAPRNEVSFVSTVLHELGHGLGFFGSATVRSGLGRWGIQGLPLAYDRNVVNGEGASILDTAQFPNASAELAAQLRSNNLFWNGAGGVAANGGNRPKLYAPATWEQGSSYAHLDEGTYRAGTPNALMTPKLASGESIYNPGPIALAILADMGWTITNDPGPGDPTQACFAETGKCIKGRFAEYWVANGGLAQQGFPLTDEFDEVNPTDGKTYRTQYFERARFEYHPENQPPYDVLLGLLGREQLLAKYGTNVPAPTTPNPLGAPCATFGQTGKQVCGVFLDYWAANGGLAQQGFPLTDIFLETNPTDGKQYPTQYFERARFEYHAELAGTPYVVLLGLLGREQFLAKYPSGVPGGSSPSPSASASPLPNARLSVTPDQGPNSTLFIVTGAGFTPSTTYYLQIARQDGSDQIAFADPSLASSSQGLIAEGFKLAQTAPAGDYVARIASAANGGTTFASANFRLTGPNGQPTGPRLSVTPSEAQAGGTIFVLAGTGFAPNTPYTLRIQSEDRQTTIPFQNPKLTSDADGVILSGFSLASGRQPGVYILEIISTGASPQVVAGTTFRIVP